MTRKVIGRGIAAVLAVSAAWAAQYAWPTSTAPAAAALPPGLEAQGELQGDRADVAAGSLVTIDVLANDGLDAGARLMRVLPASSGQARIEGGKVVFQAPNTLSTAEFYYEAKPSAGAPRFGKVTVAIGMPFAIEGRVVRAQDSAARVTLHMGGRDYTVLSANDGRYRIDALDFDDSDIGVLEAQGSEPGSVLHLQSYLGSAGRVRRLAGTDGVLERAESNAVLVSFLSTAQLIHARERLAALPADDRAYETALLGSTLSSILTTADFLDLVDHGDYPLPAGTDMLAYASRPGLIAREWNPPSQMVAVDYTRPVTGRDQAVLPTATDFDRPLIFLPESTAGHVTNGIRSAQVHSLLPDGTHDFIDGYARPSIPFAASLDANGTVFVPGAEAIVRDQDTRVGRSTLRRIMYLRARKLVKLFDGDEGDQYEQIDTVDFVYPDRPTLNRTTSQYSDWVAYERPEAPGLTTQEVVGRTALAVFCPRPDLRSGFGYCDYATHAFEANGVGRIEALGPSLDGAGNPAMTADGGAFAWSLAGNGTLRLERGDVQTDYTRVSRENDSTSGMLVVATQQSDTRRRIAFYQQAMRAASVPVSDMLVSGSWRIIGEKTAPLDMFYQEREAVRFDLGGYGEDQLDDASGYLNLWKYNWNVRGDAVYLSKYLLTYVIPGGVALSTERCTSSDGQCPMRLQKWTVLSATPDALYVKEEVYQSSLYPALPLVRTSTQPLTLHRD